MTDGERFQLDRVLRERYETAKADLSRYRQEAEDHGLTLAGLGAGLKATPEKVQPWRGDDGAWRLPFSDLASMSLGERDLPTWERIQEVTHNIRTLTVKVRELEGEMKTRGLA